MLDIFFLKNQQFDRKFTEFGGVRDGPDGDFAPTVDTLSFLLADKLESGSRCRRLFERGSFLRARHHILRRSYPLPTIPC